MVSFISDALNAEDPTLLFTASEEPLDRELLVATTFVLYSAATSDNLLDDKELASVFDALITECELREGETGDLLEAVKILHGRAARIERFIDVINQNYSIDQRQKLLKITWKVILSDGVIAATESKFAANLRNLLGLSLEQATSACRQAEMDLS